MVVRRRKVRAATVALGLVSCLLAAGCTPKPLGVHGLILDGGHPTVLLRPCPGIAVNQVWLYERTADLRWGTADSGHHAVTEVRLLQAPAGWSEPDVPVANQLTEFSSDATYQVQLSTDHPERGHLDYIEFTLGDLTSDRVWMTRPTGQRQVVTREEFDQHAGDKC